MIGAGRDTKEDSIDPAVGIILEAKVGQKIDAGAVLCRIYYTAKIAWRTPPSWSKMLSASREPPDERSDSRNGRLETDRRWSALRAFLVSP